jgi:hypothetical protein
VDGEGRGSGAKWIREGVRFGHGDCKILLVLAMVVAGLGIQATAGEEKEREHRAELRRAFQFDPFTRSNRMGAPRFGVRLR